MTDLQYLVSFDEDIIIPPVNGLPDEYPTLLWWNSRDGYLCINVDNEEQDGLSIHPSQVDDLIDALTKMKENK